MTFFTLVALTAVGFFVVPSYTGTSSAKGYAPEGEGQTVSADMLQMALDLRSATDYSVYAEQGIEDDGKSTIKGNRGVASRDAEQGERSRKDLSYSLNIIDQLPSTDIKEMTSGSFKAGVYSAPSARLSGEITLDAKDDANAIFVFRIAGSLRAEAGVSFNLINGAKASNVFFVAGDSATIGKGVNFEGNVLAKGSIAAERGSKVNGRAMSLNGAVKLTEAAVGGGDGVIEICKENTEPGLNLFGVTAGAAGTQRLIRFNSFFNNVSTNGPNQPATVGSGPITFGPTAGDGAIPAALRTVVGLDFRPGVNFIPNTVDGTFNGPLTGALYALVSREGPVVGVTPTRILEIFIVDQNTGAATFVSQVGVVFAGTTFGFDFDPTVANGSIATITSDFPENVRVNVDTGAVITNVGGPANNAFTGVAYTNGNQVYNQPVNNPAPTSTSTFVIDTAADRLLRIDPVTGAVLQVVGQLGINATNVNGFDISQANSNGQPLNGTALAALTFNTGEIVDPNSGQSVQTGLFQIDLFTGRAELISLIGTPVGPTPQFPPTGPGGSLAGLAIGPGGSTGMGNPNGLENRIFQFRVGGRTVQVPVGACSGPLNLPAGPIVIEELTDGFLVGGGTFSGRFRLMNVTTRIAGGTETTLAGLTRANLATRQATVNVVEGDISNQTVVTFYNTFAVNAVIEICKRAAGAVAGTVTAGGAPAQFGTVGNTGTGLGLPAAVDVGGFFSFTVDVLPDTTFNIPVGACSGPIQVNVPTTPNNVPAPADILVTELGRTGFQLESATTFPADRFNFLALGVGINNTGSNPFTGANLGNPNNCIGFSLDPYVPINQTSNGQNVSTTCVFTNPGGGVVSADVMEGGTSNQTTINFFNRAAPVELKICKVAGPGIPVGTEFNFEIRGTAQRTRVANTPLPGTAVLGPGATATTTGSILRFLTVQAGPGEQGGFCDFVRNLDGTRATFVVGTNIAIAEVGFNGVVPGVPGGQVRTGSIRSNTGFSTLPATACLSVGNSGFTTPFTTGGALANQLGEPNTDCPAGNGFVSLSNGLGGNPDLEFGSPTTTFVASAVITPARAPLGNGPQTGPGGSNPNQGAATQQKVEVEFVNFVFNPTTLKICKIAGAGIATGTPFTFNVAVTNPTTGNTGTNAGPIFDPRLAPQTIPVTVLAGPAGTGNGFCTFVSGPFGTEGSATTFGAFNVGSTVTVTEGATTGVTVTAITSPTGPVLNPNLPNRSGQLVLGFPGGFNEIAFVNTAGTGGGTGTPTPTPGGNPRPATAFDFDGDGKSDPTIFRPSTTQWWFAASSASGQHRAVQFGLANDTLVAADYDGDGKSDYAVYRGGVWYVMKSSDGAYRIEQFGLPQGDIPQTGDFDGDGKADLAVFRQSNGVWHVMGSKDGYKAVSFGLPGDKPVAADFDGDGKADLANYRNGDWHVLGTTAGYSSFKFGIASDKPVVADYDGDRKADAAVYRDGIWHIMRSQAGYTSYAFGLASDKPVPADYNGDGKTDLAVFRNGTWHMLSSGQGEAAGGYSTMDFGNASDVPAAEIR